MVFKQEFILFDLDGTLTDPKLGITKSVQYALKHFGIFEENLDNLIKFIGPPLKDSFQEYYGFNDKNALIAIEKYREYFKLKGMYENSVYPMIPELLEELCHSGRKLAVATSKPTVFAVEILKHFGLDKYFKLIAGSNLDGSRVNKCEVISFALNELKIEDLNQVVMVGDREYDVTGAKKVGIASIGVLYGYGSMNEIVKANPTYIADSVNNLRMAFKV